MRNVRNLCKHAGVRIRPTPAAAATCSRKHVLCGAHGVYNVKTLLAFAFVIRMCVCVCVCSCARVHTRQQVRARISAAKPAALATHSKMLLAMTGKYSRASNSDTSLIPNCLCVCAHVRVYADDNIDPLEVTGHLRTIFPFVLSRNYSQSSV